MNYIQTEVLEDILASLPIESALRSKLVCKTWRDLIRKNTNKAGLLFAFSPPFDYSIIQFFYTKHPLHHEIDLKKLQLVKLNKLTLIKTRNPVSAYYNCVGSCNGLVCLEAQLDNFRCDPVIVINPVTGKFSRLPIYSSESKEEDFAAAAGFGYVPSTNEYKVVRIYCKSDMMPHVLVYTLGSPLGWREIANVPFFICENSGVFANGLLHWADEQNIVSFDLGDECFYPVVPSPPFDYSRYTRSKLLLLGGHLCLQLWAEKYMEIWSFKKRSTGSSADNYQGKGQQRCYYDDSWSWSKDYGINCDDDPLKYQAFAISSSNEVLLSRERAPQSCESAIYSCDPKSSTLNKVWEEVIGTYIPAIPHMNTLVSMESEESGELLDDLLSGPAR